MQIVNKSTVTYVEHMGSDLRVCDAARVSFDKKTEWDKVGDFNVLKPSDARLIKYLAEHGHTSPFRHCFLTVKIDAPIFVARQLGKHQVGLSWNEISRRYVDYEPSFFFPKKWRKRAPDKKQGSLDESVDYESFKYVLEHAYSTVEAIITTYNMMLDAGVAPEQARMILPQNMMTSWYWSGSLQAFAHIHNLRAASDTQPETQEVAHQIDEIATMSFPVSWKFLTQTNEGN